MASASGHAARERDSVAGKLMELACVFAAGPAVIAAGSPWVGEDPLAQGAVVWVANLAMLAALWYALRRRGQGWSHLGLAVRPVSAGEVLRGGLLAVAVFVAALVAFAVGAVAAALVFGRPETADVSGYAYLQGNPGLLVAMLLAVYFASSFGEEALYRGFLITRLAELSPSPRFAGALSVSVSAVIFGLVHYAWGPGGMIQTGFMGLALGIAYLALGRRLWILVIAHAGLDTLLLLQVYLAGSR